ncbi:MAG: hypothetical protein ACYCZX_15960, partial [Rhodospirillaceae bacterium]
MNYTWFVQELRRGYPHHHGIKTLCLGTIEEDWLSEIRRETAAVIRASHLSAGGEEELFKPQGSIRPLSLLGVGGAAGDGAAKRVMAFPGLGALARVAALFGESLCDFRISGIGKDAVHSALEENAVPDCRDAGHAVRFRLPVFSNDRTVVYMDDKRFSYKEGSLYYFHRGCVHAAANFGDEVHYELILDCLLDRTLFGNLFPGGPSADPGFRKSSPDGTFPAGAPFTPAEILVKNACGVANTARYGRKLPAVRDERHSGYPAVLSWFDRRRAVHA